MTTTCEPVDSDVQMSMGEIRMSMGDVTMMTINDVWVSHMSIPVEQEISQMSISDTPEINDQMSISDTPVGCSQMSTADS